MSSGTIPIASRRPLSTLAAVLALCGCGSDPAAPGPAAPPECPNPDAPRVPLCDGSSGLTLRIFAYQTNREILGGIVRVENGYTSFAVDGQCQYYLSGGYVTEPTGRDDGWRKGVLPDDARRALECQAGLEDLSSVYDCRFGPADAPTLVIANVGSSVACTTGGGGEETLALFARVHQLAPDLWTAGQLLDGGMHIVAVEGIYVGMRPYPWPDELDLRDYLKQFTKRTPEGIGQSTLVPAADAAPLRALREQFLRNARNDPTYAGDGIPVSDGNVEARLFMRDALPYEDDRGLWGLPGE